MTEASTPEQRERRRLAGLCRRLASVPTSGGSRADRVLTALADRLDRQIERVESLPNDDQLLDWRRE